MNEKRKSLNKTPHYLWAILLLSCTISFSVRGQNQERDSLAGNFYRSLKEGILNTWYPLMIDSAFGGYFSNATYDWKLMRNQPKMLVTQSRHIWTCSQAAMFLNDSVYTRYAFHG